MGTPSPAEPTSCCNGSCARAYGLRVSMGRGQLGGYLCRSTHVNINGGSYVHAAAEGREWHGSGNGVGSRASYHCLLWRHGRCGLPADPHHRARTPASDSIRFHGHPGRRQRNDRFYRYSSRITSLMLLSRTSGNSPPVSRFSDSASILPKSWTGFNRTENLSRA